jgi:ureidoglycolate lyase
MVALGDRPIEFVVVQYANGVAEEDCQETEMGMKDGSVTIDLTHGVGEEQAPKAKL